MQAAVATKSEEKKKTAQPRPETAFSGQALEAESPASAELPLFLRRSGQTRTSMGAADDPGDGDIAADKAGHSSSAYIQRKCSGCSREHKCSSCRQEETRIQTKRAGSGSQAFVQRSCSCGGSCSSCQSAVKDEPLLQRQAVADAHGGMVNEQVIPSDSTGRPLENSTRAFMESQFGSDFSEVRIHTDSPAAQSASKLQADAYTTGRDITLPAGSMSPLLPKDSTLSPTN